MQGNQVIYKKYINYHLEEIKKKTKKIEVLK